MFNYDTNFKPEFNESVYTADASYEQTYNEDIYKIKTNLEIPIDAVKGSNSFTLGPNEVITFRAPSFVAAGDYTTYPAYVNYYLHLSKEGTRGISAIPATMQPLKTFLRGGALADNDTIRRNLNYYINNTNFPTVLIEELSIDEDIRDETTDTAFKNRFEAIENTTVGIFTKNNTKYE
jgi:hypothetical protein